MASLRCKMCGGAMEVLSNETVITCEYCGTQQTRPKFHDEKLSNMLERADQHRRSSDYDKAIEIYEEVLTEVNDDADIYWSLVLCKYGIDYVDDPATGKKIPTVNRAQYTSIYNDNDYQSAIRYADTLQRSVFESEAATINEIQKGILDISSREEPYDVFICYKETDERGERTPDSVLAQELYFELKELGYKVFFAKITLEDKLGSAYEPYIFAALHSSKVMVVMGTKAEYFQAPWVKNEWSRFLALMKTDRKRTLIPAYRNMDPYYLPKEFSHLQALDMNKLGFMSDLTRGISKIVGEKKQDSYQPPKQSYQQTYQQQTHQTSTGYGQHTTTTTTHRTEQRVNYNPPKNQNPVDSSFGLNSPLDEAKKRLESIKTSFQMSDTSKPDFVIRDLKKKRTKFIILGIVFLYLFWPASIYFFVKAYKTHKEIKGN